MEALRYRIVVPMATRQNAHDQTVLGHKLPAGAAILLSFASLNRDAASFAQPDRFLPDRWISNPYGDDLSKFGGFGVGGRACPLCASAAGRALACRPAAAARAACSRAAELSGVHCLCLP